MNSKETSISRRQFVKMAGVTGVGATVMGSSSLAQSAQDASLTQEVPKRTFGKTGEKLSVLSLGGAMDFRNNQLLLRQAVKMGVTYWDTAEMYGSGASEKGIGKYFEKYPDDRKKIFLVTKSKPKDPAGLTKALEGSLERLKTSYVDLYFLHAIKDATKHLTPGIKAWADKMKKSGKIRYFGFSTHENVEECLETASKLDWIDGIMMTYNCQTMGTDRVKAAVEACAKAGIGLTAMKTQAKVPSPDELPPPPPNETEKARKEREAMIKGFDKIAKEIQKGSPELTENLMDRFMKQGFSMEQAKLKVVWESSHIASICSHMPNMTIMMQNIAAAVGKVQLTQMDKDLLFRHAAQTRNQYCAGCTRHCQSGDEKDIPIGLVMRCLMYARDYGDRDKGKTLFHALTPEIRQIISQADYVEVEKRCPNGLPIGRLMREAVVELA